MKKTILFLIFTVLFSKLQAQTTFYVDSLGSGDGSSWATASNDLQLIIDNAIGGDQVWVKQGNYQRGIGSSFLLNKNVSLYGGFPNVANPTFEDRNPNLYETILKGNQSRVLEVLGNSNPISSSTFIDGFTITEGNSTSGAGLYATQSSATYRNLKIVNNTSTMGLGAGVNLYYTNSTLYQVLIANNTSILNSGSDGDSAGMRIHGGEVKLINCVVADNHAQGYVGGIWAAASIVHLYNSIVYGNTAELSLTTSDANDNYRGANYNVTYAKNSILQNSTGSDYYLETPMFNYFGNDLGGNLDVNPMFNSDYSLQQNSPGINEGDSQIILENPLLTHVDFFNNNRILDVVDIGLNEYQLPIPDVLYVKENGTGDGTSWENASGNLQLMMDRQVPGNQVWVAEGTYDNNGVYFKLREGVKVFGSFPSVGNPTFEDRDYDNNQSVLTASSGIILGNFHHETRILSPQTTIDGFVVTSNSELTYGIFDSNSEVNYSNMTFEDNHLNNATIEIRRKSNPTFTACKIVNNSTTNTSASTVYLHSEAKANFINCHFEGNNPTSGNTFMLRNNCAANVIDCMFTQNAVLGSSYVAYVDNSSANFINTIFEANGATLYDGGVVLVYGDIFNNEGTWTHPLTVNFDRCVFKNNQTRAIYARGMQTDTLVINNSLFYGNKAHSGGALRKDTNINLYINNSTFTENQATGQFAGALFFNYGGGVNEVRNSIIYNNSSVYAYASQIYAFQPVSFKNSILPGSGGSANWNSGVYNDFNIAPLSTDLGGNLDVNPMFIDIENKNFRLSYGSPAINAGTNAIFSPNTIPNISMFNIDLDGNARIYNSIVDMGAFEFDPNFLDNKEFESKNYIKIFPNPANDFVYIETEKFDFLNVTIFSIDGKQIAQTTSKVIDVTNYSKGIYIFQIELSNQKKYSKKIIVK